MAHLIPTTIGAVLILVLGILPGMPGDIIFSQITGRSWLERDFQHFARMLGFSVAGLVFYGAIASWLSLPVPEHIVPSTFLSDDFSSSQISHISKGYLGHLIFSAMSGAVAALGLAKLRRYFPGAASHEDVWDDFAKTYARGRWVIVTLASGESYAGMLQQADISREPEYRDMVLCEPAVFDENRGNYIATSNQYLYLRGDQIASIGAVSDLVTDERVTEIGQVIFPEGTTNEQ